MWWSWLTLFGWIAPMHMATTWRASAATRICLDKVHAIADPQFEWCERNADCLLPEVCCIGPWFQYCCDIGALTQRWARSDGNRTSGGADDLLPLWGRGGRRKRRSMPA